MIEKMTQFLLTRWSLLLWTDLWMISSALQGTLQLLLVYCILFSKNLTSRVSYFIQDTTNGSMELGAKFKGSVVPKVLQWYTWKTESTMYVNEETLMMFFSCPKTFSKDIVIIFSHIFLFNTTCFGSCSDHVWFPTQGLLSLRNCTYAVSHVQFAYETFLHCVFSVWG